jgi:hypothetical protein
MAAGLGFKDFVTGEVLTAADVDGYLMQGIWVFDDATARDAAVTSPQEGNACYLKDTNEVLTYSGSVWVAVGGGSPLTTKGDLYTFSTVDARLAVGANDTVLTADSSEATGLKWATPSSGGMTLLSTTTLSGASTTISSISQDYTNLYIVGKGLNQGANASYFFRLNGNDTAADYSTHVLFCTVSGSPVVDFVDDNNGAFGQLGTSTSWNGQGYFQMTINRYTETENKLISSDFRVHLPGSPDVKRSFVGLTAFNSTTAISSIKFVAGSGSHDGTVYIYGVN